MSNWLGFALLVIIGMLPLIILAIVVVFDDWDLPWLVRDWFASGSRQQTKRRAITTLSDMIASILVGVWRAILFFIFGVLIIHGLFAAGLFARGIPPGAALVDMFALDNILTWLGFVFGLQGFFLGFTETYHERLRRRRTVRSGNSLNRN